MLIENINRFPRGCPGLEFTAYAVQSFLKNPSAETIQGQNFKRTSFGWRPRHKFIFRLSFPGARSLSAGALSVSNSVYHLAISSGSPRSWADNIKRWIT